MALTMVYRYPYYAKWIRSHRDLPLRLNQWNSVVRTTSISQIAVPHKLTSFFNTIGPMGSQTDDPFPES